jgi:hypothetical protein
VRRSGLRYEESWSIISVNDWRHSGVSRPSGRQGVVIARFTECSDEHQKSPALSAAFLFPLKKARQNGCTKTQ